MDNSNANKENLFFKKDCVCFSANEDGMKICSGYVIPDCAECDGYKTRSQRMGDQVLLCIRRLLHIGRPLSPEYKLFFAKYSEYSEETKALDREVN